MRYCKLLVAVLVLLLVPTVCLAHKVNVFAYVDGDMVHIEASFSKRQKVVNGKLVLRDSETGDVVHEGTTDGQGRYSFRPSDAFLATGHGLDILLQAGEGHQDTWQVLPSELKGAETIAPEAQAPPPQQRMDEVQDLSATNEAVLEAIVGRVLDAKLAPVKETLGQVLAEQANTDPELKDIVGGLGWIAGLLGLVTYIRYRRQR